MKPALLRVLPAAALSVPLLVAGVATATAATMSPASAPTGSLFTDEGHPDPAPTASAQPTAAAGEAEQASSDEEKQEMSGQDEEEMAGHDEEEMAGHDEEEMAGHDEEETAGHDEEETAGHEEGSDDEHGSTASEGDRPRAAVLSSFAGVNAAVLGGAAFLRRRDRNAGRHRPRRAVDAGATPASGTSAVAPTAPASDS